MFLDKPPYLTGLPFQLSMFADRHGGLYQPVPVEGRRDDFACVFADGAYIASNQFGGPPTAHEPPADPVQRLRVQYDFWKYRLKRFQETYREASRETAHGLASSSVFPPRPEHIEALRQVKEEIPKIAAKVAEVREQLPAHILELENPVPPANRKIGNEEPRGSKARQMFYELQQER